MPKKPRSARRKNAISMNGIENGKDDEVLDVDVVRNISSKNKER